MLPVVPHRTLIDLAIGFQPQVPGNVIFWWHNLTRKLPHKFQILKNVFFVSHVRNIFKIHTLDYYLFLDLWCRFGVRLGSSALRFHRISSSDSLYYSNSWRVPVQKEALLYLTFILTVCAWSGFAKTLHTARQVHEPRRGLAEAQSPYAMWYLSTICCICK